MSRQEEIFESAEPYKPYLQDGVVHKIGGRELATNYMTAFYGAFLRHNSELEYEFVPEKSQDEEAEEEVDPVEEVEVIESAPEEEIDESDAIIDETPIAEVSNAKSDDEVKPKTRRKVKKNFGAMIVTFISTLLLVAMAVLSSFKALKSVTYFFTNAGTREIFGFLVDANVEGYSIGKAVLTYAISGTALVTALFVFLTLIFSLVAIGGKKRYNVHGAFMLIALIAWIGCGIVAYFGGQVARDNGSILSYINPFVSGGISWGFYIVAVLILIGTISGFSCYKKKVSTEIVL